MKLVTFYAEDTVTRVGALLDGDTLVDLYAGALAQDSDASHFIDMLAFIDAGSPARDHAAEIIADHPSDVEYALEQVTLLAPVPRPRSIRDCMAFETHLVQATRTVVKWRFAPLATLDAWVEQVRGTALFGAPDVWYERPVYYKSNTFSVVGPGAQVQWPAYTEKLDYELEFGIFIGKTGRDILRERAHEHIAGYTIFNDFSARDIQLREMDGRLGPAKGKDFDTGNVLGPYLVTPDEIPDPYDLTMTARVNGEEWSRGNSSSMYHTFADIIAYISQSETLYPGEFIGSGTVGNGCGLELDRWLQPGDIVELEVDGLGVLRNQVVAK